MYSTDNDQLESELKINYNYDKVNKITKCKNVIR